MSAAPGTPPTSTVTSTFRGSHGQTANFVPLPVGQIIRQAGTTTLPLVERFFQQGVEVVFQVFIEIGPSAREPLG